MKITLTLISFLRPVFFIDRGIVPGMADGSLKKSALISAFQILRSLTKFPPIITLYI